MNDADLLPLQHRFADLSDDRLGAIERQRSRRRNQAVQRLPFAELAGDEQPAARILAEVQHAGEAIALRALQLLQLALRALERGARRQRGLRDQLVRDGRAALRVARAPDIAGARAAELRLHLVALRYRSRDRL